MSTETTPALRAFAADHHLGVLATLKRDGRPQMSHVSYAFDEATGVVRMSLTDDRAKVKNLRRDPRGSLFVRSDDGWAYAVLEGDVELSPIAADPGDAVVAELTDVFKAVGGQHSDWDEFRAAMVAEKRLVASLQVGYVYGSPPSS